jgi:hypothetical protein
MKKIIILISLSLVLSQACFSQSYKSYKYAREQINYFTIDYFYKENILKITGYTDGTEAQISFNRNDLNVTDNKVYYNGNLLFDDLQLILENKKFIYNKITDTRISETGNALKIDFLTAESQSVIDKFKRGNSFEFSNNIVIDSGIFIRGCVISLLGNITINGEVNKDVVSLFGDIGILENGVVRGDVVTLKGNATIDKQASVYGETYSYDNKGKRKHHQFLQAGEEFSFSENIAYNRVDGFKLAGEVKYHDLNSLLPDMTIEAGYAFSAKRLRLLLSFEQRLKYSPFVILGGSIYKQLQSDDNFIMSDKENTAFALFFTEDYKDFYEAKGGNIYLKYKPNSMISLESGYNYFETKWLRAYRHLWSLFGGNKLFRYNFSSVDEGYRLPSIQEIDNSAMGTIYSKFDYSSKSSFNNPFEESGWKVSAAIEWSHPDLNSDFDFRRYSINVRRFHKLNDNSVIIARGIYANSGGYLPMHRRYFLGGVGSLPGYEHKEFMGTQFWMTNFEYRVIFYKNQVSIAPSWNSSQIANDTGFDLGTEVKNSLGISLYIANQLKFEFAKRLDRSDNSKFKFYVRFDQQF